MRKFKGTIGKAGALRYWAPVEGVNAVLPSKYAWRRWPLAFTHYLLYYAANVRYLRDEKT